MADLLLLILSVPLLGCLFVALSPKNKDNAFNVTMFVLMSVEALLLRAGALIGDGGFNYMLENWSSLHLFFTFKADTSSIVLQIAIYAALLIGVFCLDAEQKKNKEVLASALLFGWFMSGLLWADDILTFYVFFSSVMLPLFLLMNIYWQKRYNSSPILFFIFHFGCSLLLLFALAIIFYYNQGNVSFADIKSINLPANVRTTVLVCVVISLISRIPIWPFHYWIAAVNVGMRHSLVYVMTNLLPLTGLYGIMRLYSLSLFSGMHALEPVLEVVGLITILLVAFIGLAQRDFMQMLFSYTTVYYLLFLLGVVMLKVKYQQNIEYALFSFVIVNSALAVLYLWSENFCVEHKCDNRGILAYVPRFAKIFIFFVLIACGLPVSAMFWNDFILVSALFRESFIIGVGVMSAIIAVSMALIYELYIMQDLTIRNMKPQKVEDLNDKQVLFFIGLIVVMCLSFFNPLWFIF